jgi:hypothetical protein
MLMLLEPQALLGHRGNQVHKVSLDPKAYKVPLVMTEPLARRVRTGKTVRTGFKASKVYKVSRAFQGMTGRQAHRAQMGLMVWDGRLALLKLKTS